MELQGGAMLALKILGMAALAAVLSVLGRIAILNSRYNKQIYDAARSLGGWPVAMRTDVPETYIVQAPRSAAQDEWSETPLWLVSKGEVTRISPEDVWSLWQQRLLRWYFVGDGEGGRAAGANTLFAIARDRPGAHPSIMAAYNMGQMRLAVFAIVLLIVLFVLMVLFADELGIPSRPEAIVAALIQGGI